MTGDATTSAASTASTGPWARRLAAALGDRANELAAQGLAAEVPGLWEAAIADLDDADVRDRITLAYAWYQALHGEVGHGVRLAAELRDSPVGTVRGQIRVLVRNRWRLEPDLVRQVWSAATGSDLPDWVRLDDDTVQAVADWVSSPGWKASRSSYLARVEPLPVEDVVAALEELLLGGGDGLRAAVGLHRAVLSLGASVAYPCLTDATQAASVASEAILRKDWTALRAVGTLEVLAHRQQFLGSVHVVAAETMAAGGPPPDPRMISRLTQLARQATPDDRERAAADVRAIGHDAVAGLGFLGF